MIESIKPISKENELENVLRPQKMADYVGQKRVKENLKVFIKAAQKRNEALEHVLLYGSAGLGKTTLSNIIANKLNSNLKATSGPALEKVGDLASILTNLEEKDVLFIDEIHRLNKLVEEALYPAMEDYKLDIIIGKGPSARTLQLDLPKFTLIGATTRIGLLTSPLRSRFGMTHKLDFYSNEEIASILERSASILHTPLEASSCQMIAECSRNNPRIANRLLKRIRDVAQVKGNGTITPELVRGSFKMLEIDKQGLEPADRNLLEILIEKFDGGPVGISTLAAAANEEKDTIEEIYEPYLLKLGFLKRTPRGRQATRRAYKHLGLRWQKNDLGI